jgi:PadR family transcriptional regulator, regulatory protein PadR
MVDPLVTDVSMTALPKFRRGVTALAVLLALDRGESYGYEIRRDAFRRTKGLFTINEGALYPLLHSLPRRGLVRIRQERVKGRWRKCYRLTERGRKELSALRRDCKSSLKVLTALVGG